MNELIGSLQITPSTVAPGQSVRVEVLAPDGAPYAGSGDVAIWVDGVRTPSRYFQFPTTGTRTVIVHAIGRGRRETASAKIEVKGKPLVYHRTVRAAGQPAPAGVMPFIVVRSDPTSPYKATFRLTTPPAAAAAARGESSGSNEPPPIKKPRNATNLPHFAMRPSLIPRVPRRALAAPHLPALLALKKAFAGTVAAGSVRLAKPVAIPTPETQYVWSFGDGQTKTTSSPVVTHDYLPAITPDGVAFPFDVHCRIVHDNITVARTLVLYSAYGMCRANGHVVPPVTGDTFATLSGDAAAFSASLFVYNMEATPLTLDHVAIVPVTDDSAAPVVEPAFTQLARPVVIAPKSSALVAVHIKRKDQLYGSSGKPVRGFIASFRGQLSASAARPSGTPKAIALQPQVNLAKRAMTPTVAAHEPVTRTPGSGTTKGAAVRFSRHIRIRLQDQALPAPLRFGGVLNRLAVTRKLGDIRLRDAPNLPAAVVHSSSISVDDKAGVVAVPLTTVNPARPHMMQVRHSVLAALGGVTD